MTPNPTPDLKEVVTAVVEAREFLRRLATQGDYLPRTPDDMVQLAKLIDRLKGVIEEFDPSLNPSLKLERQPCSCPT